MSHKQTLETILQDSNIASPTKKKIAGVLNTKQASALDATKKMGNTVEEVSDILERKKTLMDEIEKTKSKKLDVEFALTNPKFRDFTEAISTRKLIEEDFTDVVTEYGPGSTKMNDILAKGGIPQDEYMQLLGQFAKNEIELHAEMNYLRSIVDNETKIKEAFDIEDLGSLTSEINNKMAFFKSQIKNNSMTFKTLVDSHNPAPVSKLKKQKRRQHRRKK